MHLCHNDCCLRAEHKQQGKLLKGGMRKGKQAESTQDNTLRLGICIPPPLFKKKGGIYSGEFTTWVPLTKPHPTNPNFTT